MKKYHISKDGQVRECRAKTVETCRAVSAEFPDHFTEKFKARESVEKHYAEQELLLKTLSKNITAEDANLKENRQKLIPINSGKTAEEANKEFNEIFEIVSPAPGIRYYSIPMLNKLYNEVATGKIPDFVPQAYGYDDYDLMTMQVETELKNKYGYYGRMSKKTAESLVENLDLKEKTVLDFMAGRGYGVNALRDAGVDVIATDDQSWNSTKSSHIENLDAIEALDKYGAESDYAFMSWSPYDNELDLKILQHMKDKHPHLKLIVLGEEFGCTNSEKFWETTSRERLGVDYGPMGAVRDDFFLIE